MKNMLRKVTLWILLAGILLSACGGGASPTESPPAAQPETCGDGICMGAETSDSCPADCVPEDILEPQPTPTEEIDPLGYITFVVNVNDIVNLDDSATILLKLIDLFESVGVKGDFYLTGPMTRLYMERHPEVIQRLNDSGMTISYHVRPPHPLVPGFQGPLQIGAVNIKQQRIAAYEAQRLDLTTGGLISEEPGGYQYLEQVFGGSPVAVFVPNDPIRGFVLPYLSGLGAQLVVLDQERGTDLAQPLQRQYSMWVRPNDLSIMRWVAPGVDTAMPWWSMLESEYALAYQPLPRLQGELEAWNEERLPFVVVPIDEYNFYREGAAPWSLIYYQDESMSQSKAPPFDLTSPDPSSPRSSQSQGAVWEAYAGLVAWAATYMEVVTSADIVALANGVE